MYVNCLTRIELTYFEKKTTTKGCHICRTIPVDCSLHLRQNKRV